ncbi:GDP-L-fucose synthase [bacterium]|nr:GDP-L-fucose synthase [bacterium]
MDKNLKIYVAGHRGLVGSALVRNLEAKGYKNIVKKTSSELDLTDSAKVFEFFEKEKPDWVFLAAAKVGGIHANSTYPVDFMLTNLKIQNNVIEASYKFGVKKLMFLGSSCIYPKNAPQPMKEECLLTSELEPTNEPYALAKISGICLCDAYNRQYGTDFMAVMPCNLYGISDSYHNENGHVLPMFIRRFHEAKLEGKREVTIWGSGTPRREFMISDDLADACVFLMETKTAKEVGKFVNVGTGVDLTIMELAQMVAKTVGWEGEIKLDPTKPDGTMKKMVDVTRLKNLGWEAKTTLEEGLKIAYNDFLNNENTRLN